MMSLGVTEGYGRFGGSLIGSDQVNPGESGLIATSAALVPGIAA
jgi:hypothetical protein